MREDLVDEDTVEKALDETVDAWIEGFELVCY